MNASADDALNVLVIGAGMYACGRGTDGYGTILPALFEAARTRQRIKSVTICSTTPASAKQAAEKASALAAFTGIDLPVATFPEQTSQSYRDLLKNADRFDAAILAVPDDLHFEIASAAIDAGLHTLVVKPFVTTLADGIELTRRAEKQNVYGAVEFHKRFDVSNLTLRDRIERGDIGQPLNFVIEYSQRRCIPEEIFSAWAARTNIFQYLGVHYADMVYFVTGATPKRLCALGQKQRLIQQGIDTHDAIQVMIEWERDGHRFTSTHLTHWVDPNSTSAMSDQRIKVIGTDGRIECDQKDRGIQVVTDTRGIEALNPYFSAFYGPAGSARFEGYGRDSIEGFIKDVQQIRAGNITAAKLNATPRHRPTFRDALVSTAIVEAVNLGLQADGAWIDVAQPAT